MILTRESFKAMVRLVNKSCEIHSWRSCFKGRGFDLENIGKEIMLKTTFKSESYILIEGSIIVRIDELSSEGVKTID